MDEERVKWLRIYGIPCHAWNSRFFEFITKLGIYICLDDGTREHTKMGVAKLLVRTRCYMVLNETFIVKIDENLFKLKVMEDTHGPLRISLPDERNSSMEPSSLDTNSDGWQVDEEKCSKSKEDEEINQ